MLEKNGAIRIHHGFYETDEELGIKKRTPEEEYEYRKLIGMPLIDDLEKLISLLENNTNQSREQGFTKVKNK